MIMAQFHFHSAFPDATDDQKMEQVRLWRNAQLAATDWTQVADAPVDAQHGPHTVRLYVIFLTRLILIILCYRRPPSEYLKV